MEIQQKENGNTGMFFIEQAGKNLAKMVYTWAGDDRIMIEHTAVDNNLKGQGAGKELVAKSVAFAREKNITIVPVCSFAKSIFNKTKEYEDVL